MATKNNIFKMLIASAGIALLAACTPATQPAATQAPATQAPATEAPAVQAPATDTPAPVAQAPATDTPAPQSNDQQAAQPAQAADTAAQNTIQKLNLNTSSGDEFLTVPNVGNRMVREFQEYRPYSSIQQFRREIGKYVDASQVAEYEKYLFVPISPNDADADTLQQLPGVDASIAEQLIAGRPYATKADFVKKLGEFVSADQLAIGEGYVEGE